MRTFLVHLYPASWRYRYGDEFAALLDATPMTPRAVGDVAFAAIGARLAAVLRFLGLIPGSPRAGWSTTALAALLMLAPSVAALGAIALKFKAGVGEPFDALWFGTPLLTRYLVLMFPVLSVLTATIPLISVATQTEPGRASAKLGIRLDRMSISVGIVGACVLAALIRYFLVRDLLTMPL